MSESARELQEEQAVGEGAERTSMVTPRMRSERPVPGGALALVKPLPSLRKAPRAPSLFCPMPSGESPHAAAVQARSVAWAVALGLVAPGAEAHKLERAKIGHLGALVFHDASEQVLQLAADWTTLFCLLDDHLESEGRGSFGLAAHFAELRLSFARGEATRRLAGDVVTRALLDVRARLLEVGGVRLVARFGSALTQLLDAFVDEEENRQYARSPSPEDYEALRAQTVGLWPQFLLGELAERVALSPAVHAHPTIAAMERAASLAVGYANDVCTYEKELAAGEIHNLVFVLMEREGRPLPSALARAVELHDEQVCTLLALAGSLPDFGDEHGQVLRYVSMLQRWVRGHLDWSALTGRYAPS